MDIAGCGLNDIGGDLVVVFDLDDTLFDEVDFTLSGISVMTGFLDTISGVDAAACGNAMRDAALSHLNHFDALERELDRQQCRGMVDMPEIVALHRMHLPLSLPLRPGMKELLDTLYGSKVVMGIITDGRDVTQSNKIKALGIGKYFDPCDILISERYGHDKLSPYPFLHFMERYPGRRYCYIGDNPAKDFVMPGSLGWITVCMADRGRNIHAQGKCGMSLQVASYKVADADALLELLCNIKKNA